MRVLLGKKLGRLILMRNTRRFFLGLRLFFRKFVFDSHAFFFPLSFYLCFPCLYFVLCVDGILHFVEFVWEFKSVYW